MAILSQQSKKDYLAGRLAEQRLREVILSSLPSRDAIIASDGDITITLPAGFADVSARLNAFIEESDLDSIVKAFPIRETGVLRVIASALRFANENDYEQAALTAINADQTLQQTVKSKLAELADILSRDVCVSDEIPILPN